MSYDDDVNGCSLLFIYIAWWTMDNGHSKRKDMKKKKKKKKKTTPRLLYMSQNLINHSL